ncbi:MAG: prepilin-type N-terminal cleavage/methylation domain-containing protein [Minisyncoccota bacterium]
MKFISTEKNNLNKAGQSMVEAMVAMSIIVIGLLGVFTLSSNSISLNRVAADRYIAVNLANEGIELVKNLIDNNAWNAIPGVVDPIEDYEIDYNDLAVKQLNSADGRPLYFSKEGSGYYAYDDGDINLNVYTETVQGFRRIIKIQSFNLGPNSLDHVKITSTVSWRAKDGTTQYFYVEDHFYNTKDFEL